MKTVCAVGGPSRHREEDSVLATHVEVPDFAAPPHTLHFGPQVPEGSRADVWYQAKLLRRDWVVGGGCYLANGRNSKG